MYPIKNEMVEESKIWYRMHTIVCPYVRVSYRCILRSARGSQIDVLPTSWI